MGGLSPLAFESGGAQAPLAPPISQPLNVGQCRYISSNAGGPRIQGNIQFQLTSEVDAATPVFTLTCTYTGGPAITVSWHRDGVVVSGGTTVVTDPATTNYTSTLTVTGRKSGNYSCAVANSRSSATSQMLLVQGELVIGTNTSMVLVPLTGVSIMDFVNSLHLLIHDHSFYQSLYGILCFTQQLLTHPLMYVLDQLVPLVSQSPGLHQLQEPL